MTTAVMQDDLLVKLDERITEDVSKAHHRHSSDPLEPHQLPLVHALSSITCSSPIRFTLVNPHRNAPSSVPSSPLSRISGKSLEPIASATDLVGNYCELPSVVTIEADESFSGSESIAGHSAAKADHNSGCSHVDPDTVPNNVKGTSSICIQRHKSLPALEKSRSPMYNSLKCERVNNWVQVHGQEYNVKTTPDVAQLTEYSVPKISVQSHSKSEMPPSPGGEVINEGEADKQGVVARRRKVRALTLDTARQLQIPSHNWMHGSSARGDNPNSASFLPVPSTSDTFVFAPIDSERSTDQQPVSGCASSQLTPTTPVQRLSSTVQEHNVDQSQQVIHDRVTELCVCRTAEEYY